MLAQEEAFVRPGSVRGALEGPGCMNLRLEARLALFRRLARDPLPSFELPVRPFPRGLERPRADDGDDIRTAELGRLLDDGLQLFRLHQAGGQGDPRPRRLGFFHAHDGNVRAVPPDPLDAGEAAAPAPVEEPDLFPDADPGRPGQVMMFIALENDAVRVCRRSGEHRTGSRSRFSTSHCRMFFSLCMTFLSTASMSSPRSSASLARSAFCSLERLSGVRTWTLTKRSPLRRPEMSWNPLPFETDDLARLGPGRDLEDLAPVEGRDLDRAPRAAWVNETLISQARSFPSRSKKGCFRTRVTT